MYFAINSTTYSLIGLWYIPETLVYVDGKNASKSVNNTGLPASPLPLHRTVPFVDVGLVVVVVIVDIDDDEAVLLGFPHKC